MLFWLVDLHFFWIPALTLKENLNKTSLKYIAQQKLLLKFQ